MCKEVWREADEITDDTPLWKPSPERVAAAPLTAFMAAASERAGRRFSGHGDLHDWSVDDREAFWSLVWDFCGVVGEKGGTVLVDRGDMAAASFFPEAKLNFAENLLCRTGAGEAIVFRARTGWRRALPGTSSPGRCRDCSNICWPRASGPVTASRR